MVWFGLKKLDLITLQESNHKHREVTYALTVAKSQHYRILTSKERKIKSNTLLRQMTVFDGNPQLQLEAAVSAPWIPPKGPESSRSSPNFCGKLPSRDRRQELALPLSQALLLRNTEHKLVLSAEGTLYRGDQQNSIA